MIVEFFFIPGTTIFGIVGFIGAIAAIYYAFQESYMFGYVSIGIGAILFAIFFMIGKKMFENTNLNLESEITSKVNTYNDGIVNVGDFGMTNTVLKPNGKAIIENQRIEVFSMGDFIEKDIKIVVIKLAENKIFVNAVA